MVEETGKNVVENLDLPNNLHSETRSISFQEFIESQPEINEDYLNENVPEPYKKPEQECESEIGIELNSNPTETNSVPVLLTVTRASSVIDSCNKSVNSIAINNNLTIASHHNSFNSNNSSFSFTNLINQNPFFFRSLSLPLHPQMKPSKTFRAVPKFITDFINVVLLAKICLFVIILVLIVSFVVVVKGYFE